MFNLLSHPNVSHETLTTLKNINGDFVLKNDNLPQSVTEQLEIIAKYSGYIERQKDEVNRLLQNELTKIPENFDYDKVKGLSFEVRSKLKLHRPETIGQASRISGVTPAAISLLLIFVKSNRLSR